MPGPSVPERDPQVPDLAVFACNTLLNFISANYTLHNHLLLETIDSVTSGLVDLTFTSSKGAVKNPQFWGQCCRASVSAFRRYLLRKKLPRCWATCQKG